MKQFKHLKTFESFSGEEVNEEILNKLIDKAKSAISGLKAKFSSWKDGKKKEAAAKMSDYLAKNPGKLEEIKGAFDKLSEEDKAKLAAKVKSFSESDIDNVAAKAGVSESMDNVKRWAKIICGWIGLSSAAIGVITMIIGMVIAVMTGGASFMVCLVGMYITLGAIVPASIADTGFDKKGKFHIAK
jgi:hypothetical protein